MITKLIMKIWMQVGDLRTETRCMTGFRGWDIANAIRKLGSAERGAVDFLTS